MRLTRQLFVSRKKRFKFLFDKLVYKDLPLNAPALKDVEIEKVKESRVVSRNLPRQLPPELADDPRFYSPPKPEERSNYREKPAFLYNKNCRFIEGTKQACFLTKSVRMEGMPENVQQLVSEFEIPDESRLLQKAVMKAQSWESTKDKLPKRTDPEKPLFRFAREFGIPRDRSLNMLSFDLLRLAEIAVTAKYPNAGKNRRMIFQPNGIATFFNYKESVLSFYLGIDAMLTSPSPLPPFLSEERVEASMDDIIPSIYPIMPTIDFYKSHNYNLKNATGYYGECERFPHTLILLNNDDWTEDERQARALVTAMGVTVGHVKRMYPEVQAELPKPMSVQVINLSETTLNFTYFQLNTIDFDGLDNGVKNFVWFDTGNVLFEKHLPQPWKEDCPGTRLENLDIEPFRKLLASVGYCAELEDTSSNFKDVLIEL